MRLIKKELLTLKMANYRTNTSHKISILLLGLIIVSCANFKAYFNTFYNAEAYFEKAEKSRLENRGDALPKGAQEDYQKVIEKSQIILSEFPEFNKRKDAYLMIIQSQYYLGNYKEANISLSEMKNEFLDHVEFDAVFWSSMIKWKEGKVQPAINDLTLLIANDLSVEKVAKVHLAIAEVYFDQDMKSQSMDNLEKAAETIQDAIEKGQIYYRIANLSFDDEDYDRALNAYQQVIKHSQTKKQIQEAHLRSVQIFRLQGDLDFATRTIKNMLLDENYTTIHSDLELELAKLYDQQGMVSEVKNRLESIVQDYRQTAASAEAYYMLGQLAISPDWDLEEALKNFQMVSKEYKTTLLRGPANIRVKEINAYINIIGEYDSWMERVNQVDSLGNTTMTAYDEAELSKVLYEIAELEIFHFSRRDSGVVYLDQLIELTPTAKLVPKALYSKSVVLDGIESNELIAALRSRIVNEYPATDYALAVIRSDSTFQSSEIDSDAQLVSAEQQWVSDPILALDSYKSIVLNDTISETSAKAAYFLAHQYDYTFIRPDSALKYYEWLMKYHQGSDQANKSLSRISILNVVLADSTENYEN